MARYISIWFRYLKTDWMTIRNPEYGTSPLVLSIPDHGRMIVSSANRHAEQAGIYPGMAIADARAIYPSIQVVNDNIDLAEKLLRKIAIWMIRYTPVAAIDLPDAIILDASGCTHLWGGEEKYCDHFTQKLSKAGYTVRVGMADSIGAAWAIAHYGQQITIAPPGKQLEAVWNLPPEALRLDITIVERLRKLGLTQVGSFINMPHAVLQRRFGQEIITRINQAKGTITEIIEPVIPPTAWQERLPCLEPVSTATAIEIGVERLLEELCKRLMKESKGLRIAILKCFRIDGKIEQVQIGTHRASSNAKHLFKLFELKLSQIEPDLGIELFILEAGKVEDLTATQEKLWMSTAGLENTALSELLDRLSQKIGDASMQRYLPAEHYWPERSVKRATNLLEQPLTGWKTNRPRPLQILTQPAPIEVTAPITDYPPMLFRYQGKIHRIKKADGPERIEQEWWLQQGQHRDYYCVEDDEGCRYWIFRSGHYDAEKTYQWFLHGFFA